MKRSNIIGTIVVVLAIVGAINWGLVGFFNFNLVDALFGGGSREETSTASRVIYALVGLSGLVALFFLPGSKAVSRGYQEAGARA